VGAGGTVDIVLGSLAQLTGRTLGVLTVRALLPAATRALAVIRARGTGGTLVRARGTGVLAAGLPVRATVGGALGATVCAGALVVSTPLVVASGTIPALRTPGTSRALGGGTTGDTLFGVPARLLGGRGRGGFAGAVSPVLGALAARLASGRLGAVGRRCAEGLGRALVLVLRHG
jgi:hypothetical protein